MSRDGRLRGPNVELYRAVTRATTAPVIASGGISSIGDLVVLAEAANLEGSIVGHALHAGRFTLPEALAAMHRIDEATRFVVRPGVTAESAIDGPGFSPKRANGRHPGA